MNALRLAALLGAGTLAFSVAAQDTNDLSTAIGQFESGRDVIIAHGFDEVGSIPVNPGDVRVLVRESQNLASAERVYGLAVIWRVDNAQHLRILVDDDELDALINAVNNLNAIKTDDVTTLPGFEASFTTRAALRVIAHSERRDGTMLRYLQFEDYPRISLTSMQLQQFRDLLQQARKKIDALKPGK